MSPEATVQFPAASHIGPAQASEVGILVVEADAITPVGPRIVFVNEAACLLSGYDQSSLVGSPLGLIYDRDDLPRLIQKLPTISQRSTHCWMDRVLIRNGGVRQKVHWTIRPTGKNHAAGDFFTLTIGELGGGDRRPNAARQPMRAHPAPEAAMVQPPLGNLPNWESTSAPSHPLFTSPSHPLPTSSGPASQPGLKFTSGARSETGPGRLVEPAPAEPTIPMLPPPELALSLTAAGVAHDFKNALQAIKSNLELARIATIPGSRSESYLLGADHALHDAESLARQMMSYSRGVAPGREVFSFHPLVRRVSHLCTAGSRIRCQLSLTEGLRPVEGSPDQIYQVLHNLVINACQSMPNGGTLHLNTGNAELSDDNAFDVPAGRYSVVSVRDRGHGIPDHQLARVFDADFSTKSGGSGIGLAWCKSIIDSHGGGIRAASQEGVGTEFLIFLPSSDKVLPEDAATPDGRSGHDASTQFPYQENSRVGRILVVEDQPDIARATCGLVQHLGYTTVQAADGAEAIRLYRQALDTAESIDLVLLDMTLPGGLHGDEVARELARLDPEAKLIATSGYFGSDPASRIYGKEFLGSLPKPYSLKDLSSALESALSHP
jgi:CheY-like chemotaxis protein